MVQQSSRKHKRRYIEKSKNPLIHYEQPVSYRKSVAPLPQPSQSANADVSYRIYPNGEFGLGFCPRARKAVDERRYDRMQIYGREFEEYDRIHELEDGSILEDGTDVQQRETLSPKLGIGAELSQMSQRKGSKGITGYGRKMLRNAGTIIDIQCKNRYGQLAQMGTLTTPSLSKERMALLNANWHHITRRFFQECKRLYARFNRRFDYAFCTEVQPSRWERLREVGLHIHFLFVGYRSPSGQWSLSDNWVRLTWRRIICSYVGEENVERNLNYRREPVRQSSAAYLAKYASKGTDFIREITESIGADQLPSQWWGASTRLKACIKTNTLRRNGRNDKLLLYLLKTKDSKYIKYSREVRLTIAEKSYHKGREISGEAVLGYGGMLTQQGIKLFFPQGYEESIRDYMACTLDR